MKIQLTVLSISLVLLTAAAEVPAPIELSSKLQPSAKSYRADHVIVRLKSQVSSLKSEQKNNHVQKLAQESNLEIEKLIEFDSLNTKNLEPTPTYAVLKLDETRDTVADAIARLEQNADVEMAQPDFIYTKTAVPNDPSYGKLWALKNTAQTLSKDHLTQSVYATGNPGTAASDIGAEAAWDRTTDCSNVIVAVVDTGIKLDHDDLKDNLWSNMAMQHGYDFVNSDTNPTDDEGHGSHVAGTIGARGNNAIGTTGICWKVQLMAVKVLDNTGSGSTSGIISGVNYAVTNGAHIINMSLGGAALDPAFQTAVNNASNAGVLVVVAAGNDGANNSSTPTYPCNFPAANLICVGAVDQRFSIASFSNYSTTFVDIAAPGTNIVSAALNAWSTSADLSLAMGSWTASAGYGFAGGFMQYPAAWNGTSTLYSANANDTAYTTVDMSGTTGGVAYITVRGDAEAGYDFLDVYEKATAGDPVAGGTQIGALSGSSGGGLAAGTATLTACAGSATCSLGFNFNSDNTNQRVGYRIERLQIDKKIAGVQGLDGLNGTSMATPHVAGLAALVKANNPAFTAADLRAAILTTGTKVTALTSRFATGAVINAAKAVKFVDAPTGVAAAVVP